jgi:hypothetical protein
MDVFFVMLMFFLVVPHYQRRMGEEVNIPEKDIKGKVNAFVQIVDPDEYLWFDSDIFENVYLRITDEQCRRLSSSELSRFLNDTRLRLDREQFSEKILQTKNLLFESVDSIYTYSLLVRCPDNMPFGDIYETLNLLKGENDDTGENRKPENLSFYLLGGEIDDLYFNAFIENGICYLDIDF